MSRTNWIVASLAIGAGLVVAVFAGDLTPPAGPVQPTMKTLDQIHDAVLAGGAGSAPCGEAPAGAPSLQSTGTIDALPGTPPVVANFEVLSLRIAIVGPTIPVGGGGTVPPASLSALEFVKPIDAASPSIFRAAATAAPAGKATFVLSSAPGASVQYRLDNVQVSSVTTTVVPVCGGSVIAERVTLSGTTLRVTHFPSNLAYIYNFATGMGSP